MSEETFQHHFKTKLLKETSSFCIDSLLSNKPADRKHPARAASPPPQNGAKNIPGKYFIYIKNILFSSARTPVIPASAGGVLPAAAAGCAAAPGAAAEAGGAGRPAPRPVPAPPAPRPAPGAPGQVRTLLPKLPQLCRFVSNK